MPRTILTITALLTAIVVAVGCGSDSSSSSDAASLAPAGSLVYGEATLEPEGDQKAAIDSIIEKFPGQGNAGERIRDLMQKAFADSDAPLSYKDDIEPWLGDQAAFFMSSFNPQSDDAAAALLVKTDDEEASESALEKGAKGEGKKATYKEHDYYVFADDDSAAGVVDGWVVLGSARGYKAAVNTVEGGKPIEDDDAYKNALADAAEERLGFVYFNSPGFLRQLKQTPGVSQQLSQLERFFREPVVATMDVDEAGARFEATMPKELMAGFPVIAEGSGLAAEVPADAWLAMAQPEMGKVVDQYIESFGAQVGGRDAIAQQLKAATGLDLERDVISWMGDWSLFVRGASVAELDGALVIETKDEAASRRFIQALARLARQSASSGERVGPLELGGGGEGVTLRTPDVPQPIHLFQRDGKVVAAYGDAAARDALAPAEKLGDSQGYADAEKALGGDYQIAFYLAVDPILQLADSAGAGSDADWQEAKPYLEPFGALVSGAREDGDKIQSVFGLTVD